MRQRNAFYITTAISYPNGPPHIGHAYEAIATDCIARFERLDGKDVFFLTGTDEHGLKMQKTAEQAGLDVRDLADRNSERFKEMTRVLNISQDDFIRTTEKRHHDACQELWQRMHDNGDIFLKNYGGWYSVRQEAFFKEAETELKNGIRYETQNGTPVEWAEEETYFFKLSAYADRLIEFYDANPDFILPLARRNEIISFVKRGLEDLSISRSSLDWGIPIPTAPDHVMYVWIDALTNYVTGTGFPNESDPRWKYWPADIHVIGKDITRFHAVYWPAFLMSAGLDLPRKIFGHGFILSHGSKMSKSTGNVVDPFHLAEIYGVDQTRYFFLREVTFGQDGNCSPELMTNRINADLANGLGNLAQRSLSMIAKSFGNELPTPDAFEPADEAILSAADGMYDRARAAMDRQEIRTYLDAVWATVDATNKYFATEKPFDRALPRERKATILYVTAEVIRQIAILVQPAMPESSSKLLDLLAQTTEQRSFNNLGPGCRLAPGTELPLPHVIFPRLGTRTND